MQRLFPEAWMPLVPMQRLILHWTGGGYIPNSIDLDCYHFLIGGDGIVYKGKWSIADNVAPISYDKVKKGTYAAHTSKCNSGSIGLALCCMHNAQERPFNPGSAPMTRTQWDRGVQVAAVLAKHYKIPVTPKTILSHAEVQGTLKIPQKQKWDITVLPFDRSISGATAIGNLFREQVVEAMKQL